MRTRGRGRGRVVRDGTRGASERVRGRRRDRCIYGMEETNLGVYNNNVWRNHDS